MTMRAAILEAIGRPLVIEEVDLREPGAHEVVVRIAAIDVCITDALSAPTSPRRCSAASSRRARWPRARTVGPCTPTVASGRSPSGWSCATGTGGGRDDDRRGGATRRAP
jgi:hypothetical protein